MSLFLDTCSRFYEKVCRSIGFHFTLLYTRKFGMPLVGAKCITEHAHASYKYYVIFQIVIQHLLVILQYYIFAQYCTIQFYNSLAINDVFLPVMSSLLSYQPKGKHQRLDYLMKAFPPSWQQSKNMTILFKRFSKFYSIDMTPHRSKIDHQFQYQNLFKNSLTGSSRLCQHNFRHTLA